MDIISQRLLTLIWIISILLVVYGTYFLYFALFGLLKKKQDSGLSEPRFRFLVIIAARNEQLVIANLVDSLMKQNYPRNLFDVLVVPNNCTDRTAEVALQHGANILECSIPVRTKGEVLSYAFQNIPSELSCDAYCIFDADNVVHPDFLPHMNHALCNGTVVAQGYRDTKNPHDTYITACWSMIYWVAHRFYNYPHSLLHLSSLISGTGFMFTSSLLQKMGGWHTETMAEDFEFTMQCILAGEKIDCVPEAVTFDEQSLTLAQSWIQRKRWMIGFLQAFSLYIKQLFLYTIKTRTAVLFDFLIIAISPVIQYLSLILFPLGFILRILILKYPLFPLTPLYDQFFLFLGLSVFAPILVAFTIALSEKKLHVRLLKGILAFPFFLATQIPINIICLFVFRHNFRWDEIRHTRTIKIDDLK